MSIRPVASCVLLVLLTAILLAVGCSGGVEDLVARPKVEKAGQAVDKPPSSPPQAPPPPPPTAQEPVGGELTSGSGEGETPVEPPSPPPVAPPVSGPPASPPSSPAPTPPSQTEPSTERPSIRLSTGVALPQTGPNGTMMGFSVDYEFTQGGPSPASRYVWVIEPTRGQPVKFMGPLKDKDTLQVFVQHWRPENGPFESHIEDARGNRLSPTIPLR